MTTSPQTRVPALVDDVNPEVAATQLVLDAEAFSSLAELAQQGIVTSRAIKLDDLPAHLRGYQSITSLGFQLGFMSNALPFWVGDLLVWAEEHLPEEYAQIAHETGLSERTLLNRRFVCANVTAKTRRPTLSYTTHSLVAGMNGKEQKVWLDLAESKGLSSDELRERMKAKRRDERPELPGMPNEEHVLEVAKAILRDAKPNDDGQTHLVPNEDIVRLRAALGEEDA